jgi:hypothetical protein
MGILTLLDELDLTYTINPRTEHPENVCYRIHVVFRNVIMAEDAPGLYVASE